jgi:hypothetical protein
MSKRNKEKKHKARIIALRNKNKKLSKTSKNLIIIITKIYSKEMDF